MISRGLSTKTTFLQKMALVSAGAASCLLVLELGLRLAGFTLTFIQEHQNKLALKNKEAYRIVCLGESTTFRQYPRFLEEALNKRNIGVKFSVIDEGKDDNTTGAILASLKANLDKYNPDMVITMMGINEEERERVYYRPGFQSAIADFFDNFKAYKLSRFLWLHAANKINTIKLYIANSKEELDSAGGLSGYFSREKRLCREIALAPDRVDNYLELGKLYLAYGEFPKAEAIFKKALELDPKDARLYLELGKVYYNWRIDTVKAQEMYKKAISLDPDNKGANAGLIWVYYIEGKLPQAEEACKKSIRLEPKDSRPYIDLAWFYVKQGKFLQAKQAIESCISANPEDGVLFAALANLCSGSGETCFMQEYYDKADKIGIPRYNPQVAANYLELKNILDKRKIRLVCVQYPMRDIRPLKGIFRPEEGIVFVDNKSSFREVLKNNKYSDYFRDMFAGDFGHCTDKGNMLLAENISSAIIKEAFKK